MINNGAWISHLSAAGEKHTKLNTDPGNFFDFSRYFKEEPLSNQLLSEQEIHALMNPGKAKTYMTRSALNMMRSYGLAESKTVAALQQKIDKQQRPELTLKFSGDTIYEGTGFGSGGKRHELKIYADGKPVKDFAVTFGKPDIANMKKTAKGTLLIENVGRGDCPFTIIYKGFKYNFRWHAS